MGLIDLARSASSGLVASGLSGGQSSGVRTGLGSRVALAGRVVAVTGGARGIGMRCAEALAERGVKVAIGDLDAKLAAKVGKSLSSESFGCHLDVTRSDSFEAFLARTEARLGPLSGLVNNAGIMPLGAFVSQSDSAMRATMEVNYFGVIVGMRLALPGMVERGEGHVVNVASMGGRIALPGAAVYSGTKFAVIGLTEAVRTELRGTGVFASLVLPTLVDTDLGSGVPTGRGFSAIRPETVARGVVSALESRRNRDVYVPSWMKAVDVGSRVIPAVAMNAIRRLLGDDRALVDLDIEARASYESRIADSRS